MINEIAVNSLNKDFESIKKIDENGVEYWEGRELMPILGYGKWEKAEEVIARAAQSCINSGQAVDNHFHQLGKMVGSGLNMVKNKRNHSGKSAAGKAYPRIKKRQEKSFKEGKFVNSRLKNIPIFWPVRRSFNEGGRMSECYFSNLLKIYTDEY